MAPILPHSSSPPIVSAVASSVTTASFTPPANSLLVARCAGNSNSDGASAVNGTITDSMGLVWQLRVEQRIGLNGNSTTLGYAVIYTALVPTSAPMTVTLTSSTGHIGHALAVGVYTDSVVNVADPVDAIDQGFGTSEFVDISVSTTADGCQLIACGMSGSSEAFTPKAGTVEEYDQNLGGWVSAWMFRASDVTSPPGAATVGSDGFKSGNWVGIALKPPTALEPHSSSPPPVSAPSDTVTTASFTPPAGGLLVARVVGNADTGGIPAVSISDSQGLTWTNRVRLVGHTLPDPPGPISTEDGYAAIYTAVVPAAVPMTVTVTHAPAYPGIALDVDVYTAAVVNVVDPVSVPAIGSGNGVPVNVGLTTTVDGSHVIGCGMGNVPTDRLTAQVGTQVQYDQDVGGYFSAWMFRASGVKSPPGAVSIGSTNNVSSGNWAGLALNPVSAGPTVASLAPAQFTLAAAPLNPAAVSVDLAQAEFTIAAVPVATVLGVSVMLTPVGLAFTAVQTDPVPGAVSVTLAPATFTIGAVPAAASAGGIFVDLEPAVFTLIPVTVTPIQPAGQSETFATVADVAVPFMRPLSGDETALADTLLQYAAALIRHRFRDIDDRIAAGSLNPMLPKLVVVQMVLRAMRNPNSLRSETTGPFTRSYDTASTTGYVQLTDGDEQVLAPPETGSAAIGSVLLQAGLAPGNIGYSPALEEDRADP